MLSRFTKVMFCVTLMMLMVAVFGSVILGSLVSPRMISIALRVETFLIDYAWVFRLWRYGIYTAIFLFWPTLGRKARAHDRRDWTDGDVRDWNGYRYRLVAILMAIDIVIIDQWPFRWFEGISS